MNEEAKKCKLKIDKILINLKKRSDKKLADRLEILLKKIEDQNT